MAITGENSPSDGKVWGLFKLPFRNSVNSNPTPSSSSHYHQSQSNGIVDGGANGQSSSSSSSVSSVARSLIPTRRRLRLDPPSKLYFPCKSFFLQRNLIEYRWDRKNFIYLSRFEMHYIKIFV